VEKKSGEIMGRAAHQNGTESGNIIVARK